MNSYIFGVLVVGFLLSLDFYCRLSSTVAYKEIVRNYLKYSGSIVGGVLLSLEFNGRHTGSRQ
jgi:hypothetical protein